VNAVNDTLRPGSGDAPQDDAESNDGQRSNDRPNHDQPNTDPGRDNLRDRARDARGRALDRAGDARDRALDRAGDARDRAQDARERAATMVADKIDELKPHLRGWLHTGVIPLLTAAFAVLIVLSPTPLTVLGSSIYAASALLLFTVSGIYHRGNWQPRLWAFWRRFDHANIFIFIAGTYTPFVFLYVTGNARWWLLALVWTFAVAGSTFKIIAPGAPRWLGAGLYVAMGWLAVAFLPLIGEGADKFPTWVNVSCAVLVAAGGILYSLGAVVYAAKRPNPSPKWFGFHEVFHALTVLAFAAQYIAVSMATYNLH
jgi:hemolysin III